MKLQDFEAEVETLINKAAADLDQDDWEMFKGSVEIVLETADHERDEEYAEDE